MKLITQFYIKFRKIFFWYNCSSVFLRYPLTLFILFICFKNISINDKQNANTISSYESKLSSIKYRHNNKRGIKIHKNDMPTKMKVLNDFFSFIDTLNYKSSLKTKENIYLDHAVFKVRGNIPYISTLKLILALSRVFKTIYFNDIRIFKHNNKLSFLIDFSVYFH